MIAELISQNYEAKKNNKFEGGTGLQKLFIVLIKSPEKYILTSKYSWVGGVSGLLGAFSPSIQGRNWWVGGFGNVTNKIRAAYTIVSQLKGL